MKLGISLLSVAFGLSACAGQIRPDPAVTRTGSPISWIITADSRDGRDYVACRSNLRMPCVLAASSTAAKSFVTVHLYLHPSGGETRYTGSMRVGFLNGYAPDRHSGIIDSTVKPGDAPFDVNVTGPVTPIPGVYTIEISLVAAPATQDSPKQVDDRIAVTVK